MPKSCCVYGCTNTSEKNTDLSFHEFPPNKKTKDAWVARIRRVDFILTKSTYVCSNHFLTSDYVKPNPDTPPQFQRKGLKRGTIPSLNLRGSEVNEKIEKGEV